ncbi:hypothetical protein QUB56_31750 [Microcoleus sp. AR_TQ3_B6]|uniref:hypothetical protein n=1 Tax=Microcoleus sp. AR_TQ3_B6 TaxID=3055284 RepID=UPI002FD09892
MTPKNKYGETPEEQKENDAIFGTQEELEAREAERQEYFKQMHEEAAAKEAAKQAAYEKAMAEPIEDSLRPF